MVKLKRSNFDAIIFDLDGVVTDTTGLHAKAWKKTFDQFLKKHSQKKDEEFIPFDKEKDYLTHVDGKPRYEGVRDFLNSRKITLKYGFPSDSPEKETICGLGNKKNIAFNQLLKKERVKVFKTTVSFIKKARSKGIRTGIISSSKNCTMILKRAGLLDLFETKIDGNDAAKINLKGKPFPDIFLRAAEQLGVAPQRSVVVEDAISGVLAGSRGGFGFVVGIDRGNISDQLVKNGADVAVKDLKEVEIKDDRPLKKLPTAIQSYKDIFEKIKGKKLIIFLDYDGTLTPIVERPEDAVLSDEMRKTIKELSKRFTVSIISGRDRKDVQNRVRIKNLYYAGSHGFDIIGPGGFKKIHQEGKKFIGTLDKIEEKLEKQIRPIAGSQIERKKFSLAVHYRRVKEKEVARVKKIVDTALKDYQSLKKNGGKKVIEVQPKIDWHKGKALRWLIQALKVGKKSVPLYIGDDLTDENAFHEIKKDGIAILVTDEKRKTKAHYTLADVNAVRAFLRHLSNNA